MSDLRIAENLALPLDAVSQTFAVLAKREELPGEIAEIAIAWAAGLFEGEGSIALHPQLKGKRRALFLGMTDLDVLRTFQAVVGAGVIRVMVVRGNRKPAWRWEVQSWAEVDGIGRMFLPYLHARRRARMEELLADPPSRNVGKCRAGHPLYGPDADVYLKPGRTPECAPCARARTARWRSR